jgi:phosphoribosylamine---glycine ligase
MNLVIIGSGGREHCLAWKLSKSPRVESIHCIPGNAGTAQCAVNVDLPVKAHFTELIDFCRRQAVGMVVVGPEAPLTEGIADILQEAGLRVFGPSRLAARMEGSKAFAKEIMLAAGVPTGGAVRYSDFASAIEAIDKGPVPVVIKYDALAAGKGVSIHRDRVEAREQLRLIFVDRIFGGDEPTVLIEEFLEGPEASVLAFVDGKTILPMAAAQDHKPVGEGDTGPNTGGMGAYAPTPIVTAALSREIMDRILRPTVDELNRRGIVYKGILYAGLMLTKDGPKVIEYNVRFGDPETQVVLPLLENDLLDVFDAVIDGTLDHIELKWRPGYAVTVVGAAGGYPGSYAKGLTVHGLDSFHQSDARMLFHAGTALKGENVVTAGGRVLNAVALGADLRAAREACHEVFGQVNFEGMNYRRDIAYRVLG